MATLRPEPLTVLAIEASLDDGGVPVLALAGELDSSNADLLSDAVRQLVAVGPGRLVFDLRALRFMDSAGIAVLINTAAIVAVVEVRNPSRILQRVIEATGLTTIFEVTP
jgi:anti-sigma B factor antagonist